MMYEQKLVASIKSNGKILREFKDTVYVPFGSEYSILLKNLNTVRAVLNIYIDGDNVVPGGLVLNPGQEVDLERAIKNGNLSEGNKFKFIERTAPVEQHRGIKLEDGLIRVEWQYEKVKSLPANCVTWGTNQKMIPAPWEQPYFNANGNLRRVDYSKGEDTMAVASIATQQFLSTATAQNTVSMQSTQDGCATLDHLMMPMSHNEIGITVPGSMSTQKFSTVVVHDLDSTKYNIVFKILGETPDNKQVREPITTKHKPECVTCGKKNKATAKFCSECGTALEIFA